MDGKWMKIEEMMADKCSTPEELYAAIPKPIPLEAGQSIKEVTVGRGKKPVAGGHFQFVGLQVTDLPQFDFFGLFNMNEDLLKKVPDKVRKRVGI